MTVLPPAADTVCDPAGPKQLLEASKVIDYPGILRWQSLHWSQVACLLTAFHQVD